ncbi:DUF6064 family protein [Azospirillum halopraeferens]|uniref:DUF6064 family protein n=1 Tax=Azospirillum halopraeferens TaxID=34010 RepID=UPI000400902C|nr:DUF6064 family protein [Azospirillum halopraeferens]
MVEWWTYSAEDFLLFSPRVYWRLFALHNAAFHPLPLLTPAVGLALALLAAVRPPGHGRWIAAALAVLWAFVGWGFVWQRYAPINWAAAWIAPLFAVQAALFLAAAAAGALRFRRSGPAVWTGAALLAVALVGYPLMADSRAAAEVFGMAPDPTAVGTLGLLLAARGGWLRALLFPVPVLWCLATGATLWAMGAPQAWLAPAAAGVAVAVAVACARENRA